MVYLYYNDTGGYMDDTKIVATYNGGMEKKAVFPWIPALVGQVGSNALVKAMTLGKLGVGFGKQIARSSLLNKSTRWSKAGSVLAGYAPEFGMGFQSFGRLARDISVNPKFKPIRRYGSVLLPKSKAEILKWQQSPKAMRQNAYIQKRLLRMNPTPGKSNPILDSNVVKALRSNNPQVRMSAASDLLTLQGSSGITKNVIPSIVQESNRLLKPGVAESMKRKIKPGPKLTHSLASLGSVAATATFDPLSAGWSATKMFLGSDIAKRVPMATKIQKKLQDIFVTNRMKHLNMLGETEQKIPFRGVKRVLDTYLLNPVTSDIKNLTYDAARLNTKYAPANLANIKPDLKQLDKIHSRFTKALNVKNNRGVYNQNTFSNSPRI